MIPLSNIPKLKEKANEHFNLIRKYILDELNKSNLSKPKKKYVENNLKSIITETPSELLQLNTEFERIRCKPKDLSTIRKVLNYKAFLRTDRKYSAYQLAKILNVTTCPYCNRQYTVTVIRGKESLTRPEFDHYYPQCKYPLLALSFFNLIPSCIICNRNFKGDRELTADKYIHPFIDNIINEFSFTSFPLNYDSSVGIDEKFNLGFKIIAQSVNNERIKNSINFFKLIELYGAHLDIISELYRKRHIFSEKYIENIQNEYSSLKLSKAEIYRLVFGNHFNEEDFLKRPFSKVTKDIASELKMIQQMY